MKRLSELIVFLLIVVSVCIAQDSSSNSGDVPASKEDIEQLFATTQIRERVHIQMEAASIQMRKAMHDTMLKKYPNATSEDFSKLDSFFDQALKDYDFEAIVDEMIPAYQRHLSKADVAAMLIFYNTSTGRKVIKEMPSIMSEATQAARPRMERALSQIADRADKLLTDAQKQNTQAPH